MPNSLGIECYGAQPAMRPDLIIAATAELTGLTILHLNKGFEVIAPVTGQSVERLSMEH
jgi:predicted nucleic acid-binding protein